MNIAYGLKQVMHRIRVKLYPNYLPGQENTFFARTDSEASLTIEQVCAAMRERGGFTGNVGDLIEHVKQFMDETAYQLCDGFAVNMKYFSVYTNLGGIFNTASDTPDHKKNPLSFRFRILKPLRELAEFIGISVDGVADVTGWIDEYLNVNDGAVNIMYIPGHQFVITGSKIKIAGDHPSVGLYFVPVSNPSTAVKVANLAENSSNKLIGIAPSTLNAYNRIEIRTQYSSSGVLLKEPRVITSKFVLEEG